MTDDTTPPKLPSLTIDWELYASYLEDSDLTDDQKRDFIEALWGIVVAFVDLGFGTHPVQQACAQGSEKALISDADLLKLLETSTDSDNQNKGDEDDASPSAKEES